MIEVVDKFNMVDMGGIDVVESQGVAVGGLFSKLLNAIQNCRHQILYNWKFAEIEIAPSPVELVFDGEKVSINEAITVTEDDVVHVYSLEPEPMVIEPLIVSENGIYEAPGDVDGFNPITVNVPGQASEVTTVPTIDELRVGEVQIYCVRYRQSSNKGNVAVPVAAAAGQNTGQAISAFNYTGALSNVVSWTTNDHNYNNLWIYGDYGSPIVLNTLRVAPRTWAGRRQINTLIVEASNDASSWSYLATSPLIGNELKENMWYDFAFNNEEEYRYYRLSTARDSSGTINGSVTFTLQGIGFGYDISIPLLPFSAYYNRNGKLIVFRKEQ